MFRTREINFSVYPLPTFSVQSQVGINEFSLSVMRRPLAVRRLFSQLLQEGNKTTNTNQLFVSRRSGDCVDGGGPRAKEGEKTR